MLKYRLERGGDQLKALRLKSRLVMTAALLLAAATVTPIVILPGRLEARDRREEERRALEVARVFAAAAEVAVDFGDRQRAAEVLGGLGQVQGPVHGRLFSASGQLLCSWGRPPASLEPPALGVRPVVSIEDDEILALVPVVTRSGQRGALQLGLGLDGLERRRAEARGLVMTTAGVVFLVGLAVAALLFSLLTRPLERVTEVAARIARGDEDAARQLDATQGGEAGEVASALGGVLDQLVSQRALLEAQNEASRDALLTIGLDGKLLVHNRRLRQLLDLPHGALPGASWATVGERLEPLLTAPLPGWLQASAPSLPDDAPVVHALSLRDGHHLELLAAPVRAPHGVVLGLSLTFRDVTAERLAEARVKGLNAELEARVAIRTGELAKANAELGARIQELHRTRDQLVQADRAIAVGRLAAGVAHEINNPLAYVVANLHFVEENLAAAPAGTTPGALDAPPVTVEELRQALREASDGTARVARIVRDLKAYSRPTAEQRRPTSLQDAMEAALSMASNELRHRAAVVREYRPAPLAVADPVQLSQVFLNLLLNAAQAIPQGAADRHQVTVRILRGAAGMACAEVRDNGSGIPPEVIGKIFDPFFTTKPQGQGTGLGLAVSMGIVTGLDGRIEVESMPGQETVFRVLLPPAASQVQPPPQPVPTPPPRPGRMLVLDDEPVIGAAVRRMCAGFLQVEAATCPREVVARIEAGERFDYILCDLMMPVMTGMDVEAALARMAPEQAARLVFMTGGAFTEAAHAFEEQHRRRILQKPFDLEQLRSALHVLDQA